MKKIYLSVLLGLFALQLSAQTYNGGTWYSLYDTEQHTNVTVFSTIVKYENIFAPTNGTLNIDYKKLSAFTIDGNIAFYESSDGGKNEKGLGDIAYTDYKNWKTGSKTTSANINYIRLKNNSDGVSVKNAKLPLAQHILLADGTYGTTEYTEAFDFGSIKWGETSAKIDTIALRSFLSAGNISITSSIPSVFRINSKTNTAGVSYKVGANACASANGATDQACAEGVIGDINLYGFQIFFCPQEAKDYTGTITISDGTSSATIAVKGKGLMQDQTITFDPATPIYDTATIAPATATSGLAVSYAFTPENIVTWDGTKFAIAPVDDATQVTINASQSGNANYNAASPVSKSIIINPSKTFGMYSEQVCQGEKVEFEGKQYGAGTYSNILLSAKNRFGSDSLVTLTVGELPKYLIEESKTMYVGKDSTWREKDLSVYEVGEHVIYDSLKTIAGCDSVYQLTLTVNALPTTYGQDSASVCPKDSVLYNDGKYYSAGKHEVTFKNWLGGDSIVTYTVKALPTYLTQDTLTYSLTDSLVWRGEPIEIERKEGVYDLTDSLTTIDGCDSVLTLHLILVRAEQSITFELTTDTLEVGEQLLISAESTSGLSVSFTLSADSLATIEDAVLTALLPGELIITAYQAGDSIYLPADSVSRTLIIMEGQSTYMREVNNNQHKTIKQLRNGQLFILRDDKQYNAQGNMVR